MEILKNSDVVIEALLDSIKYNDIDSFREVLLGYLEATNRTELAKKAGLGRRTLYDLIDPKVNFNPRFQTICSLIEAIRTPT